MCKLNKIACEKLSADYVANKTKKPFERIYTVVLNHNASGKRKENIKTEAFKKGIPYLVWASNIPVASVWKFKQMIACSHMPTLLKSTVGNTKKQQLTGFFIIFP